VAANSEWLSIADNAAMSLGSDTAFTIAAWLYPTLEDDNRLAVDKGKNSASQNDHEFQIFYTTGNRFRFTVGDDTNFGQVDSTDTHDISHKYLVVVWHDPTADTVNIQVNNGTVSSAAWSGGTFDSSGDFVLGRRGSNADKYWDGWIDQVSYWKDVIVTSDDRTWLYNSGMGRECTEIFGTVPTETPEPTETPTPTDTPNPSATPEPTITPTPGAKIYVVDLPEGGRGEVIVSLTAGEVGISVLLAAVCGLLLFQEARNLAWMNVKR
jgi:hypothetical protein